MKRNPVSLLPNCQKGGAAAEMALLLPFLVVLLFGTVELGYYFFNEHQVVKGVRDGARYGARQSFTDINCEGGTPSTIPVEIETAIKQLTRTGQLSGGTSRVSGWEDSDITITVTCAAITEGIYRGGGNAPQINVATTFSHISLFDGVGIIDDTFNLNASQQAAVMGL